MCKQELLTCTIASWFSVTMGSGIPSLLLFLMPWGPTHAAFTGIGAAFLILDSILFGLFMLIQIIRYTLYPSIFPATLRHETHALFWGCFPMAMITITSAIASYGDYYNLHRSLYAASGLYWIASIFSLFSVLVVPWYLITQHQHQASGLTAALLLPFVPPLTVAACGANISHLMIDHNNTYALAILLSAYIMLGIGTFLAFSILVLYLQRLTIHKLPEKTVIVSSFLPLGPCGQAGYAAIQLGLVSYQLFPRMAVGRASSEAWQLLAQAGPSFYGAGICFGLSSWGFGIWWTCIAISSVGKHFFAQNKVDRVGFSLGWWSFTFPLGSMNLLTYSLGTSFDNIFFKIVGTAMTACVCALWALVAIPTFNGFKRGTLFDAPCLSLLAPTPTKSIHELESAKAETPATNL